MKREKKFTAIFEKFISFSLVLTLFLCLKLSPVSVDNITSDCSVLDQVVDGVAVRICLQLKQLIT